ncbi:MAG: DUF4317 domain-containing protein [Candidatus Merdivicinus sp.]|jgi:hypothetical protein
MNEKEIAELRRRFRPDKNNIPYIRGCCVNEKGEIVSEFRQPFSIMPEEELEKMLGILRKTLSGVLGKNLMDITFTTQQVADSDEHRLLMALRNSGLEDEEAVQHFFQKVTQALVLEGNYLILLVRDIYDVPYRSRDGEKQEEASSEVFSYVLCGICPVKTTKPALGYYLYDNEFRTCGIDWLVAPPEVGFLFPAFDDRSTNIYNALYYSRDTAENHPEFANAVFCSEPPMPAAVQRETFQSILAETLSEECSYEVIESLGGQLREMVEEHKANKVEEPLLVSKDTVKGILEDCGVSESRVAAFDGKYEEQFGMDADLSPRNLVDTNRIAISTAGVSVQVKPECSGLVETRVIDGAKYILIRVEDGVEVNGVPVRIPGGKPDNSV